MQAALSFLTLSYFLHNHFDEIILSRLETNGMVTGRCRDTPRYGVLASRGESHVSFGGLEKLTIRLLKLFLRRDAIQLGNECSEMIMLYVDCACMRQGSNFADEISRIEPESESKVQGKQEPQNPEQGTGNPDFGLDP